MYHSIPRIHLFSYVVTSPAPMPSFDRIKDSGHAFGCAIAAKSSPELLTTSAAGNLLAQSLNDHPPCPSDSSSPKQLRPQPRRSPAPSTLCLNWLRYVYYTTCLSRTVAEGRFAFQQCLMVWTITQLGEIKPYIVTICSQ